MFFFGIRHTHICRLQGCNLLVCVSLEYLVTLRQICKHKNFVEEICASNAKVKLICSWAFCCWSLNVQVKHMSVVCSSQLLISTLGVNSPIFSIYIHKYLRRTHKYAVTFLLHFFTAKNHRITITQSTFRHTWLSIIFKTVWCHLLSIVQLSAYKVSLSLAHWKILSWLFRRS